MVWATRCLDRSTPRKDNLVGSRPVFQLLERDGRILVWESVLTRLRFDSETQRAKGMTPDTYRRVDWTMVLPNTLV